MTAYINEIIIKPDKYIYAYNYVHTLSVSHFPGNSEYTSASYMLDDPSLPSLD